MYLQLVQTLEFRVEPEYDPSGTDMLWTKYTIRVRGFVANSSSRAPGVGDPVASAVTLQSIQARLSAPRKAMSYSIGATTMVSNPAGLDAKLGPEPLPVVVTQPNSGSFLVECGCVVRVVDCNITACPEGSALLLNPVVSLRWTQTETFDQNWYSRLVTSGKLIVRSDLRQSADLGRPLCTPALLNDYQRVSSKYTLSPNGLELDFMFEDQEADRLPPFGCTKAKGTYTVTSERPGVTRVGTVRLELEGPKGTDRKILLLRALQMAYSKLRSDGYLTDPDGKPTPPIIWLTVTEDLFTPRVEIIMNALMSLITKSGLTSARNKVNLLREKVRIIRRNLGIALVAGPAASVALPGLGVLLGAAAVGSLAAQLNAAVTELDTAMAALPAAAAADAATVAAEAMGVYKAPPIMPSVGQELNELYSPQIGIAPPTRSRLSALLTAAFQDPCACYGTDSVDLTATGSPPSFVTNPGMTPAPLPGYPTAPGTTAPGPVPGTTPGTTPGTPPVQSLWTGTSGAATGGTPSQNGYGTALAPAEITIGPTNPTAGQLAQLGAVDDQAPYDVYHLEKMLSFDTGRVQLPGTGVGSAGGVSKIVTAHGGRARETTTWVASRAGSPPTLPPGESDDPNLVLLYGNVVANDVQMTGDGAEPTYMVAGYYVRAVLDPTEYELVPGVAPFLSPQVEAAALVALQSWEAPGVETTTNVGRVGYAGSNPLVEDGITLDVDPQQAPGFADGGDGSDGQTGAAYYQPPDNP